LSEFVNGHPLVRTLFPLSHTKIQSLSPVGRLKLFCQNWENLTQDAQILEIVKGYKIPFLVKPQQNLLPKVNMSRGYKDFRDDLEGGYHSNPERIPKSNLEFNFSCAQKRQWLQTSHKSQTSKLISFNNGKSSPVGKIAKKSLKSAFLLIRHSKSSVMLSKRHS